MIEAFDKVFTSDEVRFPCPNNLKKDVLESVKFEVSQNPDMFGAKIKEINTLDGMRIIFDGGFAMIRQSNTEPVFTLRFEAKTQEQALNYQKIMLETLDKYVTAKSV